MMLFGLVGFVKLNALRFNFTEMCQAISNKCLWVNQKGKLAAFPCEFHDFQRWNLIPVLIKKDNSVLYAVNARGILQCLTKDSSLTSCNNWDKLFFSSFKM